MEIQLLSLTKKMTKSYTSVYLNNRLEHVTDLLVSIEIAFHPHNMSLGHL